jgi:type III restriction enzyme
MELKKYQKTVIDDLSRFLALLGETDDIKKAYAAFWEEKNVMVGLGKMPPYRDMLPRVPNVCLKVPTGGGKTFLAASAIAPIFNALPFTKSKAVVWLVPSDAILEQTLKNLSNPHHPYRQKINTDFSHRVQVYSKNQLLNGQNFNPIVVHEQLSVFVLSYDSFRTSKKEGRKAYQDNSSLELFSRHFNDPSILLADTDETALIQVIRFLNPVLIVDESHHADTPLSKEMLQNFNPAFVLDLTATPKKESNIISYVDARQLKAEHMVKLPVIVYNRRTQNDVIGDAISIRAKLEDEANKSEQIKTGRYIRPIVLFQAEPRGKDDNTTFDKIRNMLLEIGIPANQIALKTADNNELRGVDLLSKDCPIRYIITINALKEGWDCPFAYVLATVANRTSTVDVEQILGRILRLPDARENKSKVLNISYVITSSNDFQRTLERVVAGLNNAGFSNKDYRLGDANAEAATLSTPPFSRQTEINTSPENDEVIDTASLKNRLAQWQPSPESASDITQNELLAQALQQTAEYDASVRLETDSPPLELKDKMNNFSMNEEFAAEAGNLRLPQFVVQSPPSLFSEDKVRLLSKEALMQNFSLRNKDSEIDFYTLEADIARVDLADTEAKDTDATPKAWKVTGADNQFFREWFNSLSSESRIEQCTGLILKQLSKINAINDRDLTDYVERIISGLSPEQLEDLQRSPYVYFTKIKNKIEILMAEYAKKNFNLWIDQGKITCEPIYAFKNIISPVKFNSTLPKSLYTSEEEANGLENKVIWELANLPNIRWWHRNISRSGFNINGDVNAFPDIIAMTTCGKILLVEPKGDHLENAESRRKVDIGRHWQNLANKAGDRYRYYMVFKNKDLQIDGAVQFDRFLEIAREL